jgi:NAD(P)-dependent dehydrogenase (short-subunit alcohol dehydrogenase family)
MQSVLITGCSSGFGLKTAVTLARQGFQVFATMRDLGKRGALDAALAAAGAKADLLALDVTDEASVTAAVARMVERGGRIDALVNNAGFGIAGFIEDLTMDEYRRQMETNFFGVVAVTKAVLPYMRRQKAGRIVNVSSIGGRTANAVLSAYNASKFAVEGFTEALAFEGSLFGVKAILIEPGTFKTEIFESNRRIAAAAREPSSPYLAVTIAVEAKIDQMLVKLGGDPQKVADVILHALTTPQPRLRYLVGTDAKLMAFIHRFVGFGAYAALVQRSLDLPALKAKLKVEV